MRVANCNSKHRAEAPNSLSLEEIVCLPDDSVSLFLHQNYCQIPADMNPKRMPAKENKEMQKQILDKRTHNQTKTNIESTPA